jgi:hypothetical protein
MHECEAKREIRSTALFERLPFEIPPAEGGRRVGNVDDEWEDRALARSE